MAKGKSVTSIEQSLFNELSQLIEQSQQQVFSYANSTLMVLFWRIGQRINDEILKNKRGEYVVKVAPVYILVNIPLHSFPGVVHSGGIPI